MRLANFLPLVAIGFLNSSMTSSFDEYGILDQADITKMSTQERPAVTSVPGEEPYLEFYNQWLCFDAQTIEIQCRDHDLDRSSYEIPENEKDSLRYVINFRIQSEDLLVDMDYAHHDFTFDLIDCEHKIEILRKAFALETGVCFYSALWPETPDLDDYEYREVTDIKTHEGYVPSLSSISDFL